ncbi:hypothetical protein Tco_1445708 [Tanacetum coccineum]
MKERERARDEEYEGLKAKCKATMTDFDNNLVVVALRDKISTLSSEAKEHKANLDRMMMEIDDLKHDRMEVVSKVVPYIAMELVHSDELGRLVGKLVSSAVFYRRCAAFEEVAEMKEPFSLTKKLPMLQRLTPSRTQAPVPSSQKATPSSAHVSKLMSPPAAVSSAKLQSPPA